MDIKSKKKLILLGSVAFLAFLAMSPSILGYTGDALPQYYTKILGNIQHGTTQSLKVGWDDDDFYITGKQVSLAIYKIWLNVYYDGNITNVGNGNLVVLRFKFTGGGTLNLQIYYTDGTHTDYTESSQSTYLTKAYNIVDYKIVSYIKFYNEEWWNSGGVWIDLVKVIY